MVSGVMTSSDGGELLLLYAGDGAPWAEFFSSRLSAPQYNIQTVTRNIQPLSVCDTTPPSHQQEDDNIYSNHVNTKQQVESRNQNSVLHQQNQNTGNNSAVNSGLNTCISTQISKSKAVVILLTPDVIDLSPFPFDVSCVSLKTCVFLFLGVEIEEVREYFSHSADHVFRCRLSIIDGQEPSICEALVQVIEAYEFCDQPGVDPDYDDSDTYQTPPAPVKKIEISKIFPKVLMSGERDVYIHLSVPCDQPLEVRVGKLDISLTCVSGPLYMCTLPAGVSGLLDLRVKCQGHEIGGSKVKALDELDVIREVLDRELQPVQLLCRAVGVSSDDVGGLDTQLAFRLQQLAPGVTFSRMFPCEDALSSTADDRADTRWPSLLHFAADFNLRTFCSQLLRYPGMLAAACTENKDGYYPSQIAAERGYSQLEADLIQFVQKFKGVAEPHYVEPGSLLVTGDSPHSSPTPSHKKALSVQPSGPYVDMSEPSQMSLPDHHPTWCSSSASDTVFCDVSYTNLQDIGVKPQSPSVPPRHVSHVTPRTARRQTSPALHSSPLQSLTSSPVPSPRHSPRPSLDSARMSSVDSPGSTSRKALKILGIQAEEVHRPRSNTTCSSDSESSCSEVRFVLSAATPPGYRLTHELAVPADRVSVSSNCDQPSLYLSHEHIEVEATDDDDSVFHPQEKSCETKKKIRCWE